MRGRWHFYDLVTGLFTGRSYAGPSGGLRDNMPLGCGAICGVRDWQSQRVDLSVVDDFGDVVPQITDWQPPAPPDDEWQTWRWDAAARIWVSVPTVAAHWRAARRRRDGLLSACDWVVARAAEQGEAVPQEWRDYRQALRDITQQPDPLNLTWPAQPA